MAIKVLVFESDAAFASELRNELTKLGCNVSVVDDGNVGLQQAGADKPDLILLSIELPRMNGFSVCNKLKKDPALKDVPLIIMSSESSDETFEQHRKLRTRAEDYVHKPISFADLTRHIEQFVKLTGEQAPGHGSEGQIVIEDEISLANVELEDEGTQIARRPPTFSGQSQHAASARNNVDADIDAFTDAAFGMLEGQNEAPSLEPVNGAHARAPSEKPMPAARPPTGEFRAAPPPIPGGPVKIPSVPSMAATPAPPASRRSPSIPPRAAADPVEIERLKADIDRAKAETERTKSHVAELEKDLSAAREDISKAREAASRGEDDAERATRAEAEVQRMQRDIDELKGKLVAASKGGTGGVSSREFLDLREALNKKDKEILNLRDQVTKKEREVLENADSLLTLERAKAELEDKSGELERDLAAAKEKVESLSADKDQAKKASEDFKARHARAQSDLEIRTKELNDAKSRAQENEARAEAEIATLKADMQQSLDHEREEKEHALEETEARRAAEAEASKKALEDAKVNAARERSDALLQRERELRQETDGKLAALHRAHTDELNRVKGDHATKLANTEKSAAEKLAAREAELEATRAAEVQAVTHERDERVGTLEKDNQAKIESLGREHAEKVTAIEADRDDRLARLKRESDERVASLENDRDARIAAVEARLARELAESQAVAEAQKAAADEQVSSLDRQLGEVRAELATLRDAKLANDQANDLRIGDLERTLSLAESARDVAQKGLSEARDRIAQMEIDLSGARGELSDTRTRLDTETARAAKAFAKWESDRTSLDRAKDALAVALQQIEEAEARTLD